MKASWQVTGIRHGPYADALRIQVEVDKPPDERGTYLFPELYGQPPEMALRYPEIYEVLTFQQSTPDLKPALLHEGG